ncbi:MAG: biotin/lipoyl-binding protein [Pseudomonadales bacterium]|jgi:multidrug resistance efflux pump|nr:biotin/lipoyl-binding protein [Pseudomonadales bacterium]
MTQRDARIRPGAPVTAFAQADYLAGFRALQSVRLPRPLYALRLLLVLSVAIIVCFLLFTPWVQNAPGEGRVTTLNPSERSQTLSTLAGGRIARWYVRDGSAVKKGDPIVDIVDLDPQLIERLDAEQRAVRSAYEAARTATRTALLNLERQKRLLDQGLTSRVEFERAQIRYQELLAKESEAEASLNQAQVSVTRQSTQRVIAPNDGTVIGIRAGDTATLVRAGDVIAEFVPTVATPAVEIYISGLDASLVTPGRRARIMFEGWPAVQFGGWPEVAIGTFGGVVATVDPVVSANGRFRVLITPDPADQPWPSQQYLRFGAKARGWILLDTVSIGYELWRRLNGFPPENTDPQAMIRGGGE